MLANATWLFAGLMIIGSLLTLAIYRFDLKKFSRSSLLPKIIMWIPIFAGYLVFSYSGLYVHVAMIALIIAAIAREVLRQARRQPHSKLLLALYGGGLSLAMAHFIWLGNLPQATQLLIGLGFASALSDVFAFFAGSFAGRHKLPESLNPRKSYEGVAGQFVGALVGVYLVQWLVVPDFPTVLWLPIGLGAALGDLSNSYVKRRLAIKDWGNALPGHGGYADRFASLAGSALLTCYCLLAYIR